MMETYTLPTWLWEQTKRALVSAEWGFDRYGEYGYGEQNELVKAVLDELQVIGEVTAKERE